MTNVLMLETAVAGEWILLANRREFAAFFGRSR